MKFVNLHTGNVFNGSSPYIHWFEGQQSTGMIYVQPLCFISDNSQSHVSCDCDKFSLLLISHNNLGTATEDINGFKYRNLESLKVSEMKCCKGYKMENGNYLHIIYIMAHSDDAAEYVGSIFIDEEEILIGADFYQENESLKINASNLGVNIPSQIQSAIYGSNVHEEKRDNILINRKFKEVVSNYWDLIANKGSYKSLINSLKWFEYGDIVKLREIWGHNDDGRIVYDDRDLKYMLSENYKVTLNSFFKTTYFAIRCALQKETGKFTDEHNPELEAKVFKWSIEDMSLKMSLLGNFYESYFMPIHTELIQCSIEDMVFSNTIKITNNTLCSMNSLANLCGTFKCTVNDGKDVVIGDVSVGVDRDTIFGVKPGETYDIQPVGVKPISDIDIINDDPELKGLLSQNYHGPGAVVPIECDFGGDKIVRGDILVLSDGKELYVEDNEINLKNSGDTLKFNILLLSEKNTINLHFIGVSGKHYSKTIDITVKDISDVVLGLYKIKRKKSIDLSDFGKPSNLFTTSRINIPSNITNIYKQYIPCVLGDSSGVGLNHVIAAKTSILDITGTDSIIKDNIGFLIGTDTSYKSNGQTISYASGEDITIIPEKNGIYNDMYEEIDEQIIDIPIIRDEIYAAYDLFTNEKYVFSVDIRINNFVGSPEDISSIRASLVYDDTYIDLGVHNIKRNTMTRLYFMCSKSDISHIIDTDNPQNDVHLVLSIDPYTYSSTDPNQNEKMGYLWRSIELGLPKGEAIVLVDNIENNYFMVQKNHNYIMFISKQFVSDAFPKNLNTMWKKLKQYIYYSKYIYFPEFHYLEPFGSFSEKNDSIDDFTIVQTDALCVIPIIRIPAKNEWITYVYSCKNIEAPAWEFVNKTSGQKIIIEDSLLEPYITKTDQQVFERGYYDIIFRYKLSSNEHELTLNSAFVKK